ALDGIVKRVEVHEVNGQLAPRQQLVNVVVFGSLWSLRCLYGVHHCMRSDVSEVQVRREARGTIDLGLAVILRIARQSLLYEFVEQAQRFRSAAAKRSDRSH